MVILEKDIFVKINDKENVTVVRPLLARLVSNLKRKRKWWRSNIDEIA